MKRQAKIHLFLTDARGVFIPRDFAKSVTRDRITGVSEDCFDVLLRGPYAENEAYWDYWQDVCDSAVLTDDDGTQYTVHQDGDCWLVEKGAEYDESSDWDLGFYMDDGQEEADISECPACGHRWGNKS